MCQVAAVSDAYDQVSLMRSPSRVPVSRPSLAADWLALIADADRCTIAQLRSVMRLQLRTLAAVRTAMQLASGWHNTQCDSPTFVA